MAKQCAVCHKSYPDDRTSCPHCGAPAGGPETVELGGARGDHSGSSIDLGVLPPAGESTSDLAWVVPSDQSGGSGQGGESSSNLAWVVPGDQPRQFLYRLTLPIGSFDQADVSALASVTPPIERPRERLNELLGAWVQRDTDTRFAVSPLAKPLGRSELAVDVRARCYRELADVMLAVETGADAIGMIFAPSVRRITESAAKHIAANLPPFITPVGVFVNPARDEIERVRDIFPDLVVQLHGDSAECQGVRDPCAHRACADDTCLGQRGHGWPAGGLLLARYPAGSGELGLAAGAGGLFRNAATRSA